VLKVSCDFHLSMGVSRKANYSILILVARPNPKLKILDTTAFRIVEETSASTGSTFLLGRRRTLRG
jgi:hypothetical protein